MARTVGMAPAKYCVLISAIGALACNAILGVEEKQYHPSADGGGSGGKSSGCDTCLATNCSSQNDACHAQAECAALLVCQAQCAPADDECRSGCITNPLALKYFNPLASCVNANCPTSCIWGSGGASGAGGAGGGSCNNLVATGTPIPMAADPNPAPDPRGGEIQLGTYVLRDVRAYATDAVPKISYQLTWVFSAEGQFQWALAQSDTTPCNGAWNGNGTFETKGTEIFTSGTCSTNETCDAFVWNTYTAEVLSPDDKPVIQLFAMQPVGFSMTLELQ